MAVFLKAAKHKIQKTTLNWGTGGHDLCGVVLHGMAVFFEEPGIAIFMSCTHHPQMVGLLLGSPHHIYIHT